MRVILAAAAAALIGFQSAPGQVPLTLVGTIDLARVEGRIDHLGSTPLHSDCMSRRSETTRWKCST
jgi:hypothetical protein